MIVKKELVVSNRKKADIMVELRKKEFMAIPKVVNKKGGMEPTEDIAEEDVEVNEDEGTKRKGVVPNTEFDYLLGMPIWNLTQEKVDLFFYTFHRRVLKLLYFTDREAVSTAKGERGRTCSSSQANSS